VRGLVTLLLPAAILSINACGSDDPASADDVVLVDLAETFPELAPGDVIALRSPSGDTASVEWIERRTGRIQRLALTGRADAGAAGDAIETIATIEVGTDGEQRGLLGHTEIDGVRYVAYTEPEDNRLVVAALVDGAVDRIVWDAGGTAGGAVGGHLDVLDGHLVLGIGQLTDWAKANGSGAMVRLDPAGPSDQEPEILSTGYTNPFAFSTDQGRLWVADNAVGDDVEHIGRGDLADRDDHTTTGVAPRAPSAVVPLTDGRLGICGFLDGQLLTWSTEDPSGYGDALGPCLTGATALADGTIVTATDTAIVRIEGTPP
jgi:hypothetical protein